MHERYKASVSIRSDRPDIVEALQRVIFRKPSNQSLKHLELIGSKRIKLSLPDNKNMTGTVSQTEQGLNIGFTINSEQKYRRAVHDLREILSRYFSNVGYSIEGILSRNPLAVIAG